MYGVYICVCMWVYIRVYLCVLVYMCVCMSTRLYVYVHLYVLVPMHVCMCANKFQRLREGMESGDADKGWHVLMHFYVFRVRSGFRFKL